MGVTNLFSVLCGKKQDSHFWVYVIPWFSHVNVRGSKVYYHENVLKIFYKGRRPHSRAESETAGQRMTQLFLEYRNKHISRTVWLRFFRKSFEVYLYQLCNRYYIFGNTFVRQFRFCWSGSRESANTKCFKSDRTFFTTFRFSHSNTWMYFDFNNSIVALTVCSS